MNTPTPERTEEALKVLRQAFLAANPSLVAKLEAYKKTRAFSGTFGGKEGHHFDFKEFFEILEKGFASNKLRTLFECMMHLYFFRGCANIVVNLYDYIKYDHFDEEAYLKESRESAEITTCLNVAEAYAIKVMDSIGVKDRDFLTGESKGYELLKEILRIIQRAKSIDLVHQGDREFIISKIPVNGKSFVVDEKVTLKDGIIYTDRPEQIIRLAAAAKPGIYLVANVPYGREVELAFYFVFVNDSDAILIENNKHSYREQIYRHKTDGTNGEHAWLNRRYEYTHLPVEDILKLFESQSKGKELKPYHTEEFPFRVIKKISECHPVCILWIQSFIDNCVHQFRETAVVEEASTALALEFVRSVPALEENPNLPALYQENIPSLVQLDTSWSPEIIDKKKGIGSGDYLLPILRDVPVTEIVLKGRSYGLTSQKQIQGALAFQKRQRAADELQAQLDADFLENYGTVRNKLQRFVQARMKWTIERAFEDRVYPMTAYRRFGDSTPEIPKGASSTVVKRAVLFSSTKSKPFNFQSRDGKHVTPATIYSDDPSCFRLNGTAPTGFEEETCYYCGRYKLKFSHILEFQDYTQFKAFYKLTPEEEKNLPHQLKDYLNQNRMLYMGNSILDDLDPVNQIKNPWWYSSVFDDTRSNEKTIRHDRGNNPFLRITFKVCGICQRKLKKRSVVG